MRIKVATWNIAGGHKVNSLKKFDYQQENISYFIDQLKKISPDIICLQEAHTRKNNSQSNALSIAKDLDMKVLVNSCNSDSPIDSDFFLGNAIIARYKAENISEKYYPDPKLYWPDGTVADTFKRNLEFASFNDFNIANTHMTPLKMFGLAYDDGGCGTKLAHKINSVIKKIIKPPIIFCGDFNFSKPLEIYPALNDLKLKDTLPDVITVPSISKKLDHIFYSPELKLISGDVVVTETDHYLCFAVLEI